MNFWFYKIAFRDGLYYRTGKYTGVLDCVNVLVVTSLFRGCVCDLEVSNRADMVEDSRAGMGAFSYEDEIQTRVICGE